jgi:hypothetical protein
LIQRVQVLSGTNGLALENVDIGLARLVIEAD